MSRALHRQSKPPIRERLPYDIRSAAYDSDLGRSRHRSYSYAMSGGHPFRSGPVRQFRSRSYMNGVRNGPFSGFQTANSGPTAAERRKSRLPPPYEPLGIGPYIECCSATRTFLPPLCGGSLFASSIWASCARPYSDSRGVLRPCYPPPDGCILSAPTIRAACARPLIQL